MPLRYETIDGTLHTWGIPVCNNQTGFRDAAFHVNQSRYRIMAVGDSFTWGIGVPYGERWTEQLECLLDVDVFNIAQSGWQMQDYYRAVDALLDKFDPNRIIIGFVNNDIHHQRNGYMNGPAKLRFEARWQRWAEICDCVYLHYVGQAVKKAHKRFAYPSVYEVRSLAYKKDGAEWLLFVCHLQAIKALSDKHGCDQPIFASLLSGLAHDSPYYAQWQQQGEEAARELGYLVVSFEDVVMASKRSDLVVNRLDAHPSPFLHRAYAVGIAAALEVSD